MASLTYREAGVDIAAGEALVEAIKPAARATARRGVLGALGGFGALFDPRAAGFTDPILVAMCVNDLVVQGAEPLFFLDYFATGRLDVGAAARIIASIARGCTEAGCALVGGETAEMPGLYGGEDYDLAGFAVGAAERGQLLPKDVVPGDTVLGLAASGLHANGFSLVRHIVATSGVSLAAPAPFAPAMSLTEALLQPTQLYVKSLLALHRAGLLRAAAHITGGGLPGNLRRVLPEGMVAALDAGAWTVPPVFRWLAQAGGVTPEEMLRVFNCGIGMAVVVADAARAEAVLAAAGERVFRIGRIEAALGPGAVRIDPPDNWLA